MTDYCDWSDLPKVACEHCQTGQKRIHTEPGGLGLTRFGSGSTHPDAPRPDDRVSGAGFSGAGPIFETKFGGACDECGTWIKEGSEGRMRDGKLVHASEEDCG